ncbi:PilN domain-containing protein [Ottowia pentelensis]|uniref:PilN domain-containing protein n=1 Tax=Ottowia pentelensis TaxID=511108 RepID=A0ABV6PR25_9BURK
MNPIRTDNRPAFGVDFAQWLRQWQAAGAMLLEWPPLRRLLLPQVPIALHQPDGSSSAWLATGELACPVVSGPGDGAAVQVLQLPVDRVLERSLTLPRLAPVDVTQAVQLDVAAASPFGAEQTVWGFCTRRIGGERLRVDVAIAARQQVEQNLYEAKLASSTPTEVWVLTGPVPDDAGAVRPIVLRGFGEGARQQITRRGLTRHLGLAALALALLAALVVTPTALQRERARQAVRSFDALQKQAAPQLAQREALLRRLERVQAVSDLLGQQLALPPVLDLLTRTVPDDAWLTSLRVDGNKLVLNGQASDAAALVQRLSAQPGAHEVRLASPATRGAGAAKETFIIELKLDARRYGPVSTGKEAS